jgi:hypothetical protein
MGTESEAQAAGESPPVTLLGLGADVAPPALAAAAPHSDVPGRTPGGRLVELREWIAGVRGAPATDFNRARLAVLGDHLATPADVAALAGLSVVPRGDGADGLTAGMRLLDREVDGGTDLLVIAVPDVDVAALIVICVLTNTEPVKVLPRGTALNPQEWMAQAVAVRDGRRTAFALREDPDALVEAIGAPQLATAAAAIAHAAARRTPMLLDGAGAVAAALLAHAAQPRTALWWQIADRVQHPAFDIATAKLGRRPILDLGIDTEDGTAGALALMVLRAAVHAHGGQPT